MRELRRRRARVGGRRVDRGRRRVDRLVTSPGATLDGGLDRAPSDVSTTRAGACSTPAPASRLDVRRRPPAVDACDGDQRPCVPGASRAARSRGRRPRARRRRRAGDAPRAPRAAILEPRLVAHDRSGARRRRPARDGARRSRRTAARRTIATDPQRHEAARGDETPAYAARAERSCAPRASARRARPGTTATSSSPSETERGRRWGCCSASRRGPVRTHASRSVARPAARTGRPAEHGEAPRTGRAAALPHRGGCSAHARQHAADARGRPRTRAGTLRSMFAVTATSFSADDPLSGSPSARCPTPSCPRAGCACTCAPPASTTTTCGASRASGCARTRLPMILGTRRRGVLDDGTPGDRARGASATRRPAAATRPSTRGAPCSPSCTRARSPRRSPCPRATSCAKPDELTLRGGRVPADRVAHGVPHARDEVGAARRRHRARAGRGRRCGHGRDPARRRHRASRCGSRAATRPSARVPSSSARTRRSSPGARLPGGSTP